ncbi:LmrA/YxaF family transcription factor [Streptomyces mirabilis]|uniref:LmrA/YxaF family transcription factor n=1 Tax=Streptomyces mirabilis TaxID=68239 RepID=UPI003D9F7279
MTTDHHAFLRPGSSAVGGACPVAAATVDVAESVLSTREVAAIAFAAWHWSVAGDLVDMRVPEERAEALSTLMICAPEGDPHSPGRVRCPDSASRRPGTRPPSSTPR